MKIEISMSKDGVLMNVDLKADHKFNEYIETRIMNIRKLISEDCRVLFEMEKNDKSGKDTHFSFKGQL